jgi:putative nucleotidyltransferase with HDIG domain
MREQDFLAVVSKLVEVIDRENNGHASCVAKISKIIAEGITTLTVRDVEILNIAALLHDIGKATISDSIINKRGRLTEEEFSIVKDHTVSGSKMLAGLESKMLQVAQIVALQHHEKWDGSGYPQGLRGEEIHLFSRIVAIADVFEALVKERPYKKSWTSSEASNYILTRAGTQFDPDLTEIFRNKRQKIEKLIRI